MTIENKFDIGQTVYLVTDPEQLAHIVTQINIKPEGRITYQVSLMSGFSDYYDFELSEDKNVLLSCGVDNKQTSE